MYRLNVRDFLWARVHGIECQFSQNPAAILRYQFFGHKLKRFS